MTNNKKLYIPYPPNIIPDTLNKAIKEKYGDIPIAYSENLKKAQGLLGQHSPTYDLFGPLSLGFDRYVLLVDYSKILYTYDVNNNPWGLGKMDWDYGVDIPTQVKFWMSGREVERRKEDGKPVWVVFPCRLDLIHIDYVKVNDKIEPTYTVYDTSVEKLEGETLDEKYPIHTDTKVVDDHGSVEPIDQIPHEVHITSVETGVHDVQYETGGNILDGLWWYNLRQELINILTIGVILLIVILFIKKYKK